MQLKSIQQKITLGAGLCLFLALGAFLIFSAVLTRRRALEEAQAQALNTARVEAAKVKTQLDQAIAGSRNLNQLLKAAKEKSDPLTLTRAAAQALLRKTLEENPQLLSVYTLWEPNAFDGPDVQSVDSVGTAHIGRFHVHWVRNVHGEILPAPLAEYEKTSPGDWYLTQQQTPQEILLGPQIYATDEQSFFIASHVLPLIVDGQFLGVTGVDLKLSFLQELVDQFNLYEGTGRLLLVNPAGTLAGMTKRPDLATKALNEIDADLAQNWLPNQTGRELIKVSADGLKVMVPVTVGQSATPWAVCLLIPLTQVLAPVYGQLWQQAVFGLGLLALALGFLWYLAGQIAQPIKVAVKFADQLANGITAGKVAVTSQDETGQLLHSMNAMLENAGSLVQTREERDNLQHSIIKLLDQVSSVAEGDLTREAEVAHDATGAIADSFNYMIGELRRIIGEVKQVAEEVTSSANRTQQTTQQLADDARTRAEQIIRASQDIDAMALSIRQVSATAETSKEVAHQSLATAKRGTTVLQNTIQGMSDLREQVQETAKRIKRLGEHSQEIGEIVQLIGDIAYRTSVLALNASIQAARAGEAGRGFAQVAEDVERLAKRSSEAAKRIAELVKTTQLGAKEAIAAMEESTHGVVAGTNLIQEAGGALVEIESVSAQLAELIQAISETAERQRQESEEVSRRMVQISAATERTATGIRQSALSVNQLAALAGDLNHSVGSFKLYVPRTKSFTGSLSGKLPQLQN